MRKNISRGSLTGLDLYITSHDELVKFQNLPLSIKTELVRVGISKLQLEVIKKLLNIDYDTLSSLLFITNRSMHLKKGDALFSFSVSDRIIAILELYSYGYEVMGGHVNFHKWMTQPNEIFLESAPLKVISTHSGILAVHKVLTGIMFGNF